MTHFRVAHDELAETGDLTMGATGYRQANMMEDIVGRMMDLYLLLHRYATPPG